VCFTMAISEKEQKYQNWIDRHFNWLCDSSSNINEVRIYAGDGILDDHSDDEIRFCAGGEKEKFSLLYKKVKEAGFSKIDVIIRAFVDSQQQVIANEFRYIKELINTVPVPESEVDEDNAHLDFLSNETPLIVTVKSGVKKYGNEADAYKNISNPRGFALIIHNENYPDPGMKRAGATNDLHYMLNLFKQLKYNVMVKRDVMSHYLEPTLNEFKSQFSKTEVDSCVVICMGHGESNGFILVDGQTINIWTDLIYRFDNTSCPQLINKPKIFIFQACQNFSNVQQRSSMDSNSFRPQPIMSDALVCFSTIPGNVSYRDSYLGSWYIYCLTETFMNHAHNTNIEELLRMTNNRMTQINDGQDNRQVSAWLAIAFNKKFYFNV